MAEPGYVPSVVLETMEGIPGGVDASEAVTIHAPWKPFLKHQKDFYSWLPKDRIGVQALLGGWGSGKTHGAMRKLIRLATLNPWRPSYGSSQPRGILAAPTHRILKQSVLYHFDLLVPPEMVIRRRGPPHNDILMSNGFRWILHSGESEIEGLDACVIGITEIHHPVWSSNPQKFLNLMARLRDPNAQYMGMIVDGLPESGWVRDTFDTATRPNPNRQTILAKTAENPNIPKETLQTFYESCPSGQEKKLLGGEWMPPIGAIYPQFDAETHLTEQRGYANVTTHIGLDIGNFGAALMAQEIEVELHDILGATHKAKGLLIVDQMLTSDESVEKMCYRIRTEKPWRIDGNSVICVDPTIRRDETNAIRNHFPQARIVKRERGHDMFPIESGIRIVQRAFADALQNNRLYIWRGLANVPNGIVDGLQRYRRNETTQEPIKDNARDHCLDAMRYLCCELLPTDRPESRVL